MRTWLLVIAGNGRANDGKVLGTFSVGNNPWGLVFDGMNIWVTATVGNNVTELRARDGALLGTYNAGFVPIGMAFDGVNVSGWQIFSVTPFQNSNQNPLLARPLGVGLFVVSPDLCSGVNPEQRFEFALSL